MSSGLIERFVSTVREHSQQGSFAQLCEFIKRNLEGLVKTPSGHLDNALETLDPQQHAIGIIAILLAKCQQMENLDTFTQSTHKYVQLDNADFTKLLTQISEFVLHCNGEQIRYAIETFAEVMHHLTEVLLERHEPCRGIIIMMTAVDKARLFESQLTSIHTNLCHLCLAGKNFLPALSFLDVDITDICKEGGRYDVKHYLLYYYYGGMIYAALKMYDRAAYFFETVITTPASVMSTIMVEAYKKYVLVNLIYTSKEPILPKYASHLVSRYIKPLAAAYHHLADAFMSSSVERLQTTVDTHREVFQQDHNDGLVKQCIQSLCKKNIKRLTKTFMTLSLSDVANRVKLASAAEAEKYVLHMIDDGEIYATINKEAGMVEFHDDPEKYNNPIILGAIQQQEALCMALNEKLADMEREISINPDYVRKTSGFAEEDAAAKATTSYTA